jgi:hypothetical protein
MSSFKSRGPKGKAGTSGGTSGFSLFGATNSGTNNGVRYLFPFYSETAVSASAVEYDIIDPVTFSSLRVRINTAGVGTGTITYTLYKNGVATALTVGILATATSGSVTASVSFAAGDRIACICQSSGTVTTGHGRPMISVG